MAVVIRNLVLLTGRPESVIDRESRRELATSTREIVRTLNLGGNQMDSGAQTRLRDAETDDT